MTSKTGLKRIGIVAAWSLMMLSGCGKGDIKDESAALEPIPVAVQSERQLTKVVLQTDWYPQPEHAGFYLASMAGWYEELGLDVEIRPGGNPGSIPQLVATDAVQFALGTTDNLLVARSRGVPLVALFPYFQHDPQCVMFHAASGIESLRDLDGRRVMVNPGATYVAWLQQSLGIRLQLIPLDFSIARFLADPEFVQQCFLTSEPWYVQQQGVAIGVLPLSSSGFDPYRVVYANDRYVETNAAIARAFIEASMRGWRAYADGDYERVHARIGELNPGQSLPFMTWTRQQMLEYGLIDGDPERREALGQVSRARLDALVAQLHELDLVTADVSADDAFALELLSEGLLVE